MNIYGMKPFNLIATGCKLNRPEEEAPEEEWGKYVKYKGVDNTALATAIVEFLTETDMEKYKDGIRFLKKQGKYVKTPYLIEDPKDEYVLIEPTHIIYVSHIREYARFLRNCGGFES